MPEQLPDSPADGAAPHRPGSGEQARAELLQRLRDRPGVDPAVAEVFYRNVPLEDLLERSDDDLAGAVTSQLELARERPQGTACTRVWTPTQEEDGWTARGHTVVQVVTDDMPFLVDSVSMLLDRSGYAVHQVVHPQYVVRRDVGGTLHAVLDEEAGTDEHDRMRESWMYLEIARAAPEELAGIGEELQKVLSDVREAVEDWPRMHAQVDRIRADLRERPPDWGDSAEADTEQVCDFLAWLGDNHFTFLGYREYRLEQAGPQSEDGEDGEDGAGGEGEGLQLRAVPGTGYGILRSDPARPEPLPPLVAEHATDRSLLVLTKANSRSTVHRPVYLDYVGIKSHDDDGRVVGERRFLGLFSSSAYTESVTRIPILRDKAQEALRRSGFDPSGHAGKALMDVLETYPRDELFATPVEELVPVAREVMHTRERRQLRLFVRPDLYGRFWSCLVYLPRDRYNTTVRERLASILTEGLGGDGVEYTAHVGEVFAARLHFVVRAAEGRVAEEVDTAALERECAAAARSWEDDFLAAVLAERGEAAEEELPGRVYARAFPEAYKEDFDPVTALADVTTLVGLDVDDGFALRLYRPEGHPDPQQAAIRLKLYRTGAPVSLSRVLPVLSAMGVEVVDERPYELDGLERPAYLYDFGLRYEHALPARAQELFCQAVEAMWRDRAEADGFNALVLSVGLDWRQVSVLRAYARYMRQAGTPFGPDSIEDALVENPEITQLLVRLFEARFDPGRNALPADSESRVASCEDVEHQISERLDEVASLDHDRILRHYLTAIRATLRTNFFQYDDQGRPHDYLAVKLDPGSIDYLPAPRPRFEIFVYSSRVEGVHLRFGPVARGGLRWSDRRDDFRTEVLGLVKAQMVKNTVIVPVGAKGGFYCKQLPDPSDREAWRAEGVACYRTFISGLLDVTDNLVDGETVPPERVVRHDGDDSYLVVAADKGTATFSDIANEVAGSYGFWLGDAFASGGSVGYDHKAMGITARGAWVSVQRHFREMGVDCQSEDFTCVGIGDMSGDVFGNGMLLSEHTRLVAAFDHRHVFLDPDPDPATSYAERRRLFELSGSSWADYDESLISEGGGVYSRQAKSIRLSPQVREVLDVDESSLTPAELIRAILLAPADLLWNGGIGTYVKAGSESHAAVGDKANDAIRVDGADLRVRCVGEGGNLGLTQLGRIEYARQGRGGEGGRIDTDFIDNSAGVDTSDHEVNIKILLDAMVDDEAMDREQRNDLLVDMTDEVAQLVLAHNYSQNLALANATHNAPALLHVHEAWMRSLERQGVLDRSLEALPSRREVAARLEAGQGLSSPELSLLLSYTKIVLADRLLATDVAEEPFLRSGLYSYFPSQMRQDLRGRMDRHPLRREIVVTRVVNDLVDRAGITFWHRLTGETNAVPDSLTVAHFVAREIVGAEGVWRDIDALDHRVDAEVQTHMRLEMRTLVERLTRWLVNNNRPPLDAEALVDHFEVVTEQVVRRLPELLVGSELEAFEERRDRLIEAGVPERLAVTVAACPPAYMVVGVVETAKAQERDPIEVARVHFEVGERLGLPMLVQRILALPRHDVWQSMARAALRDDLHEVHAQLTAQELAGEHLDDDAATAAAAQLREICGEEESELSRLSVALRVVRSLSA